MNNLDMMKTRKFLIALLLFSASVFAPHSFGQDSYERLLESPTRPTLQEVRAANIPDEPGIPLEPQDRLDYWHWLNVLIEYAPALIAKLEKTVPGATWAFLGRDTAAVADVVEAFYDSIGQPDRVVRIGMSKTTFWEGGKGKQIVTSEEIIESLEGYGFDLDRAKSPHPFILIDTLSSGGGRQGRLVIDAVYSTYAAQGKNPAELVRSFNMIGLATSTYTADVHSIEDAEEIFRGSEKYYTTLHNNGELIRTRIFNDHQILMVPHAPNNAHESGYEHFVGAWHGRFGPYSRDARGRLTATEGSVNSRAIRQSILWHMREIIKEAEDPSFLARVKAEAQALGYHFSMARPGHSSSGSMSVTDALTEKMAEIDRRIEAADPIDTSDVWESLQELGQQKNKPRLSAGGSLLMAWFEDAKTKYEPNTLGYVFLGLLKRAKRRSYITTRDLKLLAREVFAISEVSGKLVTLVADFKDGSGKFSDLIDNEAWMKNEEGWETLSLTRKLLEQRESCPRSFLQ